MGMSESAVQVGEDDRALKSVDKCNSEGRKESERPTLPGLNPGPTDSLYVMFAAQAREG